MKWLLAFLPLLIPVTADDFADSPEFVHAMDIRTKVIDGFPVVFHYGDIRTDFEQGFERDYENPYRMRQPLSGVTQAWKFRFDPGNTGLKENWAATKDFSEWKTVQVPHCWDSMLEGNFWDWSERSVRNPAFYDGAAWYACTFDATISGPRQRLEFLGIPHRVRIFLNGKLLARHEGGGQPFSIDVSDHLKPKSKGKNTLAIQIIRLPNFREREDGKGFDEIDYVHTRHPKAPDNWPYAGIPRDVTLVSEGLLTIRKTQLRTHKDMLEAVLCLSNHDTRDRKGTALIQSNALEARAEKPFHVPANGHAIIRLSGALKEDAARWSPGSPELHSVTAIIGDGERKFDALHSRFGIRDLKLSGKGLSIDGKRTFLKGVAFYEEHPETGNALTASQHRRSIELSFAAKANFARLHVAQRHPLIYRLSDEQGLMLCAEWGGFWYKEKSMGAQTKDSQSVFQSLGRCALWDLQNHPSVVIWGIHNECHQFCPEYEPFVKMGHELVDQHDWQQRPVTWAAWHPHMGEPHFEHADMVGFNEYRGAMDPFEKLDPDMKRVTRENPGKPLIILENGAWSPLGYRGPKTKKGTEDWQADLLQRQYEVLIRHTPPLAGYTYWLLSDYRSRKTYTGKKKQNGWSRMGLYNEFGEPKLVRDVFRDLEWGR